MAAQPPIKAVFQGHVHTNRITPTEGLYEIATSALTSWPLMFRWVEIGREAIRTWTEKLDVPPEVEKEAKEAWEANRHAWRGEMTESDMKADLPLR